MIATKSKPRVVGDVANPVGPAPSVMRTRQATAVLITCSFAHGALCVWRGRAARAFGADLFESDALEHLDVDVDTLAPAATIGATRSRPHRCGSCTARVVHRRARGRPPPYLGYISAISPPYIGYISAASRLHLGYISASAHPSTHSVQAERDGIRHSVEQVSSSVGSVRQTSHRWNRPPARWRVE